MPVFDGQWSIVVSSPCLSHSWLPCFDFSWCVVPRLGFSLSWLPTARRVSQSDDSDQKVICLYFSLFWINRPCIVLSRYVIWLSNVLPSLALNNMYHNLRRKMLIYYYILLIMALLYGIVMTLSSLVFVLDTNATQVIARDTKCCLTMQFSIHVQL